MSSSTVPANLSLISRRSRPGSTSGPARWLNRWSGDRLHPGPLCAEVRMGAQAERPQHSRERSGPTSALALLVIAGADRSRRRATTTRRPVRGGADGPRKCASVLGRRSEHPTAPLLGRHTRLHDVVGSQLGLWVGWSSRGRSGACSPGSPAWHGRACSPWPRIGADAAARGGRVATIAVVLAGVLGTAGVGRASPMPSALTRMFASTCRRRRSGARSSPRFRPGVRSTTSSAHSTSRPSRSSRRSASGWSSTATVARQRLAAAASARITSSTTATTPGSSYLGNGTGAPSAVASRRARPTSTTSGAPKTLSAWVGRARAARPQRAAAAGPPATAAEPVR